MISFKEICNLNYNMLNVSNNDKGRNLNGGSDGGEYDEGSSLMEAEAAIVIREAA